MADIDDTNGSLNASSRAIARNALTGYVTLALSMALGLVTTPILLRELGATAFGLYAVALGAIGFLGALEAGLGTTTITRVAARERQGPAAVSEVLGAARAGYLRVLIAGALPLVGLIVLSPRLFHVPTSMQAEFMQTLAILGCWQAVALLTGIFSAGLIGTGRHYLLVRNGFAVGAGITVVQVVAVLAGGGLVAVAGILLGGGAIGLLVQRRLLYRHVPGVRIVARDANTALLRPLFASSWRNGLAQTAAGTAFASDVLFVGLLLSPRAAAAYAVAQRAIVLLRTLSTKMVDVLTPVYAHAAAEADESAELTLYIDGVAAMSFVCIPSGLCLALFAQPLLALWLHHPPGGAAAALTALGVVLCLQAPGHNAFVLLQGTERLRLLTRIVVLSSAVNIMASVGLTVWLGVVGPALGSLTAVILVDGFVLPVLLSRELRISVRALVRRVAVPLVPGAAAAIAVGFVLRAAFAPRGFAALAACLVTAIGYWCGWLFMGANSRQRMLLLRSLRRA